MADDDENDDAYMCDARGDKDDIHVGNDDDDDENDGGDACV